MVPEVSSDGPVERKGDSRSPSPLEKEAGKAGSIAGGPLGLHSSHSSPTPSPRPGHKDPVPLLDPQQVLPKYHVFTEGEIQSVWKKSEAFLKDPDPAVQRAGIALYCNTVVTCADGTLAKKLEAKAKQYIKNGKLPKIPPREKRSQYFNEKVRQLQTRLEEQGPSRKLGDEIETFRKDPVNEALFRLFPGEAAAFETLVSKKTKATALALLNRFREALRSCTEEEFPQVVEDFRSVLDASWMEGTLGQKQNSILREQYAILSRYMTPAGRVLYRNTVEAPIPGVKAISMPPLEAFTAAGVVFNSERPSICRYTSLDLSGILSCFAEKLNESQKDISFGVSCSKEPITEEKCLGDAWRTYDSSRPPTALTIIKDPASGVCVTAAVSYPMLDEHRRYGDPAADDARYVRLPTTQPGLSVIVYSGADGSGHSTLAAMAAKKADEGFVQYCREELVKAPSLSLHTITSIAIGGVAGAQKAVCDRDDTGVTVHCGIVLVQKEQGPSYAVATLTGDMKVFVLRKDGAVEEVTEGNRGGVDPRDPGGQLGSRDGYGNPEPDIRNLSAYVIRLQPGDSLLPMSDGVHDNLDPCELGLLPEEALDEIMKDGSAKQKESLSGVERRVLVEAQTAWRKQLEESRAAWKTKKKDLKRDPWGGLEKLRAVYMCYKAEQIMKARRGVSPSEALAEHAIEATRGLREGKEGGLLPPWICDDEKERRKFAGKADHISCAQLTTPSV